MEGTVIVGEHTAVIQYSDMQKCQRCGRVWDTNDEPPPCQPVEVPTMQSYRRSRTWLRAHRDRYRASG
jgi:hypothetical protein